MTVEHIEITLDKLCQICLEYYGIANINDYGATLMDNPVSDSPLVRIFRLPGESPQQEDQEYPEVS